MRAALHFFNAGGEKLTDTVPLTTHHEGHTLKTPPMVKIEPEFRTVKKTAEHLGVSEWGLYRDIKKGNFPPAIRIGSRLRVSTKLLDEFVRCGGTQLVHQDAAVTARS
jgi:predicted DNA-binding transcriptional regulator AlpA